MIFSEDKNPAAFYHERAMHRSRASGWFSLRHSIEAIHEAYDRGELTDGERDRLIVIAEEVNMGEDVPKNP